MEQCKSRITLESLKVPFGDSKHYFYIGIRCPEPSVGGSRYCKTCSEKVQTRVQTSKKFNHGDIGGEISSNSHIYDGEWYKKMVNKYTIPSEITMAVVNKYKGEIYSKEETVDMSDTKKTVKKKISIIKKKINTESIKTVECNLIENEGDELHVDEVVFVKITLFEHNGVCYYRNQEKEKLYKRDVDGIVGEYIGRWDGVRKEINRGVIDSDNEN